MSVDGTVQQAAQPVRVVEFGPDLMRSKATPVEPTGNCVPTADTYNILTKLNKCSYTLNVYQL